MVNETRPSSIARFFHETQADDVPTQVGVDDHFECFQDLGLANRRHHHLTECSRNGAAHVSVVGLLFLITSPLL